MNPSETIDDSKKQSADKRTAMMSSFVQLKNNMESKQYFNTLSDAISSLIKICESQLTIGNQAIDDIIVLKYLKKLKHSVECMRMKYWYNECDFSNQKSILLVGVDNSGFPTKKEFYELNIDLERADEALALLSNENDLKSKQLEYILSHKKINREMQLDLHSRHYYSMLSEAEFFLPENNPVIIPVNDSDNGNKRFVIHWASFDAQRNLPVVYIMLIEYSGKKPFLEDDVSEEFIEAVKSFNSSQYKLVTICHELDKKFPNIHPKKLKRLSIGPLYINGLTRHNKNVSNALDYVEMHQPEDNWLVGYTVEVLVSKNITKAEYGLFKNEPQKEIYFIDSNNHEQGEAGVTDIERSLVIPYGAYQQLADQTDNPLNDIQKYVIRDLNEVIYL